MNRKRITSFTGLLVLLTIISLSIGCATVWRGTVTLTKAVDSASKEYAQLYKNGLIPVETHARVSIAHANYQKAAGVAHDALVAYKISVELQGTGDPTQYNAAFEAVRNAGLSFVNFIVPFITKDKANTLTSNIANATKL